MGRRYLSGRQLVRAMEKGKISARFNGSANAEIIKEQLKSLKLTYRPKFWWKRDPDRGAWHERAAQILDGARQVGKAEFLMAREEIDDIVGKRKK